VDSKVAKPQIKYREKWFDSWQEQWIILFSLVSLLAPRAIQRAMEWVGGFAPRDTGAGEKIWPLNSTYC